MDLVVALIVIILAFLIIKTVGISLWTLVGVLAIVALCVYIFRHTRGNRL